jgi:phospholipase/lecithinase/hemolysin
VVTDILDNPDEYGFQDDDVMEEGGAIWQDELHMTTEVHEILAETLEEALRAV